jgi:hypothetical protein
MRRKCKHGHKTKAGLKNRVTQTVNEVGSAGEGFIGLLWRIYGTKYKFGICGGFWQRFQLHRTLTRKRHWYFSLVICLFYNAASTTEGFQYEVELLLLVGHSVIWHHCINYCGSNLTLNWLLHYSGRMVILICNPASYNVVPRQETQWEWNILTGWTFDYLTVLCQILLFPDKRERHIKIHSTDLVTR